MKIWHGFVGFLVAVGCVFAGAQWSTWAGSKKSKPKLTKSKKAVGPAAVGSLAPGFSLKSDSGKEYKLSQFRNKYVVLEWLNHGCPFVKKHYRSNNMQTLQKVWRKKGVVWLSIVSSAPGRQGFYSNKKSAAMTKKLGAHPTAVLRDGSGKVGRSYGAMTTPHMYVIAPKGKLIYAGAIDSIRSANPADAKKAVNYVAKALKESMAGKAVSMPKTRPYGCSVKYKY